MFEMSRHDELPYLLILLLLILLLLMLLLSLLLLLLLSLLQLLLLLFFITLITIAVTLITDTAKTTIIIADTITITTNAATFLPLIQNRKNLILLLYYPLY